MKNKSKAYWQKRFLAVEQRTHDAAVDYLQDLAKAYEQADAYLRRDIELWYARFAANNEVSLAEAKKLLDRDELKEFKWTVEEYIEKGKTLEYSKQWAKELENASAKVHINRAEALRIQLRQRAAEIYAKIDQEMPILMQAQYKDAYLGTAFEVAQGSGAEVTIDLARIDDAALAKVIKKPWSMDGQTFSSRIWTNQAQLIVNLQKSLMTSLITGANKDDMIRRIAKDFKTDLYKAARLVHTESAAMAAMADKDMYEDLGTEEFEVLETLDMKTCEVCGDMDGKHFPLKDYEIGVTAPPFHPNCRGTTVPYIDEEELTEIEDDEPYPWGTRAARDPETGKTIQVPGNMTYKEWRESIIKDIGQDEWDIRKRMSDNRTTDFEQYKKYRNILTSELPAFDSFQRTKYSNAQQWQAWKDHFYIKERLSDGRYGKIINKEKQAEHMESTRKKGKSYFYDSVDVQGLFNRFAGTGELFRKKGVPTGTEYVDLPKNMDVGRDIYTNKIANGIAIKHSKNRTHIYPVYFNDEN